MTNDEIQVGRYGRTNLGRILIFAYIEKAQGERYKDKVILSDGKKILYDFYYFKKGEQIVKESTNLIDIIEKGDYVNGYLVEAIDYYEDENGNLFDVLGVVFTDDDYAYSKVLKNINIHSIVTKERFKSVEYEVGVEND